MNPHVISLAGHRWTLARTAAAALVLTLGLAPSTSSRAQPAAATAAAATVVVAEAAKPADARFDLAVSNAPAAQVFLQLATGTAYNMLVAPEVGGTLSVTLKDTTVPEAMDTLRELFGYEYRITGNRIFVYPNTVQTRLFRVNYLPGRRQGSSDIRVTSGAITMGNGGSGTTGSSTGNGTGGGNGSGNNSQRGNDNAEVRTTSDADFWRDVQASLQSMVGVQGGRSVVINAAAGVVVVKATPAELRQVENYLKAVKLSIERQVMLEAKIVEVSLSKDAQTGINWAGFGRVHGTGATYAVGSAAPGASLNVTGGSISTSADGNTVAPGVNLTAGALGRGFYGLAFQAANFAALLNFLDTQGDVQVLSSPRIATLNNQKAVLKVGSDEMFVTGVTSNSTTTGSTTTTAPTLTLQPFFSGISLDVTPHIDEGGMVMLHVHPTISTVAEKSKNINLGSQGSYTLPLASSSVNETDSIVRVKDGEIVAIGGLMKAEQKNDRTGIPLLQDAPIVGALFRQTGAVRSKRELVIMLKPTVIHEDGVWPDAPAFGAPNPQAPSTKR
ncbi:MAG: pilus (MSHA type) biogenesis protein MshL [Burkholderiales bacterium PBB5]|nr:MAG: pilus (MSHA type) biogenesis protein MshL [Burkholderiales bacterium PBB5]